MSTSSTSNTIKWANSKLAEMLRKKEEEEAMLRGNRVRHKDDGSDEGKRSRRRSNSSQGAEDRPVTQRWSGRVDYSKASPLRERPRSESGATSFHFKVSTISKETAPTYKDKPLSGFKAGSDHPGADHELYIGRELATENADDMEAYIGRDGAVEIDGLVCERELGGAYGDEVDDGLEGLELAHSVDGIPSIFSNISDDPLERAEFWKAVHRCEREPRTQTILIDASKDPELVRAIMSDETLPSSFREIATLAYQDAETPREIGAPPLRPRAWQGDAEACGRMLVRLQSEHQLDVRRRGITYKSGRGGTVQHRIVAELPHELNAAERAALVRKFCQHLETIEKGKDGSTRGLMYTAAIHAPDTHNDARNYHLHVVFYDRPARMVEGFNRWDFEIAEEFKRKGETRTRYPYRSDKLRMVNGVNGDTNPEVSGRNFIPALRREFSKITNETLERGGIKRRYDPRTYKKMGIDLTPTEHLGSKAAALEAAGVETAVGSRNAKKIWSDAARGIARRTAERLGAIDEQKALLVDLMAEGAREPAAAEPLAKLRAAVADWSRSARDVAEDSELVESFDLMEAKARSRAEKVQATCLRTLADIEIGIAAAGDVRAKAKIEKRYEDASAWLAQIDAALATGRDDIEAARTKVTRDQERVVVLSQSMKRLADELRASLEFARAANARGAAKAPPAKAPQRIIEGLVEIVGIEALEDAPTPVGVAQDGPLNLPQPQAPVTRAEATAIQPTPAIALSNVATGQATAPPPIQSPAANVAPPAPPAINDPVKAAAPPAPAKTIAPAKSDGGTPAAEVVLKTPVRPKPEPVAQRPAAPAAAPIAKPPEPVLQKDDTPAIPPVAAQPAPVASKIEKAPPPPPGPAVFDLPVHPAPVRDGSTADRQKQWNLLFDRIQQENLFILHKDGAIGNPLDVPSLSDAERELLATPDLARRTQVRLIAMKQHQDASIGRLGNWLKANAHDETKLSFGERAFRYVDTPETIQTALEKYRTHPDIVPQLEQGMKTQGTIKEVVEWIRTEGQKPENLKLSDGRGTINENDHEMRDKLAQVVAYQPVKNALRAEFNRRRDEAQQANAGQTAQQTRAVEEPTGINLATIRHPLVMEFVKAMHKTKEPEDMHELAMKIANTKDARDELLSMGKEVGVAYTHATNIRPDSKAPASARGRGRDF